MNFCRVLQLVAQVDDLAEDHRVVLVVEDLEGHALRLVVGVLALARLAEREEVGAAVHVLEQTEVPLHVVVKLRQVPVRDKN